MEVVRRAFPLVPCVLLLTCVRVSHGVKSVGCPGGSGWSDWVDNDRPGHTFPGEKGEGEHELMTPAQQSAFCPQGNISDIRCSLQNNTLSNITGQKTSCDVVDGFKCSNGYNKPTGCLDYKVQYYCQCPPVVAASTSSTKMSMTPVMSSLPTPTPSSRLLSRTSSFALGPLNPHSFSTSFHVAGGHSPSATPSPTAVGGSVKTDEIPRYIWVLILALCVILLTMNCILTVVLYVNIRKRLSRLHNRVGPINELTNV